MNATPNWADRLALAFQAGTFIFVLALVAVTANHTPVLADEAALVAAMSTLPRSHVVQATAPSDAPAATADECAYRRTAVAD